MSSIIIFIVCWIKQPLANPALQLYALHNYRDPVFSAFPDVPIDIEENKVSRIKCVTL